MALSRTFHLVVRTYVSLVVSVAPIAYVLIIFLVLGTSQVAAVLVVVAFALPPLILNVETAIANGNAQLQEMGRSFGLSRARLLWHVRIPDGSPQLLLAMRVAVTVGIKGVIAAQIVIAFGGLGSLLDVYGDRLQVAQTYAIILVILGFALAFTGLLRAVESRLLRWRE